MPSRARNVDGLQSSASGTSSESGSGSHVTTITLAFGHCGFRLRAPIRSERAADIDFFFELTRLVAAEITFVTLVWFNQSPLAALRFGSCWHMVQIVRPPQATRIVISRAPSVRLTFLQCVIAFIALAEQRPPKAAPMLRGRRETQDAWRLRQARPDI